MLCPDGLDNLKLYKFYLATAKSGIKSQGGAYSSSPPQARRTVPAVGRSNLRAGSQVSIVKSPPFVNRPVFPPVAAAPATPVTINNTVTTSVTASWPSSGIVGEGTER